MNSIKNFFRYAHSKSGLYNLVITLFLLSMGIFVYNTTSNVVYSSDSASTMSYTHEVEVGGTFITKVKVARIKQGCEVSVYRYFTLKDSNPVVEYPASQSHRTIDRETIVTVNQIPIPKEMEPGIYLYHVKAYYVCNMFHRLTGPIIQEGNPVEFIVKPKQNS